MVNQLLSPSPEEVMLQAERSERLEQAIHRLPLLEETVIYSRFGYGGIPWTYVELAGLLGTSVYRVKYAEAMAISKLRRLFEG